MRTIIFTFLLSTNMNTAYCQIKAPVSFEVLEIKKEFKDISDRYIRFKITNRVTKNLLIPNVIYFNNIMNRNLNLDIGFELCKVLDTTCNINDSCDILSQPLIPEEGYKLRPYKKNASFYYPSILPFGCFVEKGKYKIRFTYFPKNKGYKKIQSQWYTFIVLKEPL